MLDFLKASLSETDGSPSSKRLVYFIVIVSAIALCWYLVIAYGSLIIDKIITLINTLIYSSAGAYAAGRGLENSSALNNFGNPGVPSPKISDVLLKKFAAKPVPPEVQEDLQEELGIAPKGD